MVGLLAGSQASAQAVGPTCLPPPGVLVLPTPVALGDRGAYPFCSHIAQGGLSAVPFRQVFNAGDELFDTAYNEKDGVGANLKYDRDDTLRFSKIPRADLPGFWNRATGPNGRSCSSCHNQPVDDGAGDSSSNVFRDPLHTGDFHKFIQRNTTPLFGEGALQLLAEEMTHDLQGQLRTARNSAALRRRPVSTFLSSKGVSFGWLVANPDGSMDSSHLQGIDDDLVVKPFQWKGTVATVRDFVVDAAHNEIGMDGVELVGYGADPDGDGVSDELSVGDVTTLTAYVAGISRPSTHLELEAKGQAELLSNRERDAIRGGDALLEQVGCTVCHVRELRIRKPVYTEPSQSPFYRHTMMPNGKYSMDEGLDPAHPVAIDLTKDLDIPFDVDSTGAARVFLFSDLKRHDLGPEIAEPIDEPRGPGLPGVGASVFLTRPLWGVGDTAPYMHDGRAPTLTSAIELHGGEASSSRAAFRALSADQKAQVIEFLKNQMLFKPNVRGGG